MSTQITKSSSPNSSGGYILKDQQSDGDSDYLGFTPYVQAIYDSVSNPYSQTPLTVGVFGRWGTGKTTLMTMLEERLVKDGVISIWFNAWQYEKEDELWAAFLQAITLKIDNKLIGWRRLKFKLDLLDKSINWKLLPSSIIKLLLVAVPILVANGLSAAYKSISQNVAQIGGSLVTGGLAIWLFVKPAIEAVQKSVSLDFKAIKQDSNFQEHIAFLDHIREHFQRIVDCLPTTNGRKLVIFVDDLDRCSPERVLQVLDALKTFLDAEGCVFVIGLDSEVVQAAVATKYANDITATREYLSKIVQLPFQIPPLTYRQVKTFVTSLPMNLPDDRCRDVFATGIARNPRDIKRTINVFTLLWNLARKRVELKLTPVRLAKVVVIQQTQVELFRLLQDRPELLIALENYFRAEQARAADMVAVAKSKAVPSQPPLESVVLKNRHILQDALSSRFTLDDIRKLCFDFNIDFETLAGDSKQLKIIEIIRYAENRNLVDALAQLINRERPTDPISLIGEPASTEFNDSDSVQADVPTFDVPDELQQYKSNAILRRILLLNDVGQKDCNFARLDPVEIEPYFTLTANTDNPLLQS